jgi:hypothetical protein
MHGQPGPSRGPAGRPSASRRDLLFVMSDTVAPGEAFERSSFGKWRRTSVDTTREALSRFYGNAETDDDSRRAADPAGAIRLYARASAATGTHYMFDVLLCSQR